MTDLQWVLGLSVDEELAWGLAPVDANWRAYDKRAYPRLDFPHGKIADFKQLRDNEGKAPLDISEEISNCLYYLLEDENLAKILCRVVSVGVSTIGIADHRLNRLVDLRRKHYMRDGGDEYVVDFQQLIADVFVRKSFAWNQYKKISVQNDVTAKCLAHYRFQKRLRGHKTLCLINLSAGINIGLANEFGPLSASNFHPELGHAYPSLEVHDLKDAPHQYQGCPTHNKCYEAVLSTSRIRGQWGKDLRELPLNHNAWEIVSSYVSQLCWIAALATSPDMILLNGPTACLELVERVRIKFDKLNKGESDTRYLRYDPASIDMAPRLPVKTDDSVCDMSGLMGALELARRRILRQDHKRGR